MSGELELKSLELEYFVADVFTETAIEGSLLAVVMNQARLTTGKMRGVAREFNLSARVTDVRVAGSTVLVASGRLFLP